MGLITQEVYLKLSSVNVVYYESLGYIIPRKMNKKGKLALQKDTIIKVKVNDLTNGSMIKVEVKCDNPNCNKTTNNIVIWQNYIKNVHENGSYYCRECALSLFGKSKMIKTKLSNGKSFEQWCVENNRQDVLNRWDYELNGCNPSDISYSTNKKYYLKCPLGKHKSELKYLDAFVRGQEGSMFCKGCNSFAQWGIDNIGEDFLEKYWSDKNTVSPWEISYAAHSKIWIKCQDKKYHDDYDTSCVMFTLGSRCPYCNGRRVHPSDSLGKLLEDTGLLYIWSQKNKKSPYEYSPKSNAKVYWKCPDKKHENFERSIDSSNRLDFRCPECQFSKGEKRVSEYLMKNNISYIPQKTYNNLIGINGGLLSYDFYFQDYNTLLEYQGEQHKRYFKGFHKSKKDFEKQQEHDKRKAQYTKDHNINLLEIWYWDFDNIESILDNYLSQSQNNIQTIPTNPINIAI